MVQPAVEAVCRERGLPWGSLQAVALGVSSRLAAPALVSHDFSSTEDKFLAPADLKGEVRSRGPLPV